MSDPTEPQRPMPDSAPQAASQSPPSDAAAKPVVRGRATGNFVSSPRGQGPRRRKLGVIGVMIRGDRFLIIRRSLTVNAPGKLCLPGGGIEPGETEPEALIREMQEELHLDVEPLRLCWRSVTPWGTKLAWWLADFPDDVEPVANPDEVAEVHWMTTDEIMVAKQMLPSLPEFVLAWRAGEIELPLRPVE